MQWWRVFDGITGTEYGAVFAKTKRAAVSWATIVFGDNPYYRILVRRLK